MLFQKKQQKIFATFINHLTFAWPKQWGWTFIQPKLCRSGPFLDTKRKTAVLLNQNSALDFSSTKIIEEQKLRPE